MATAPHSSRSCFLPRLSRFLQLFVAVVLGGSVSTAFSDTTLVPTGATWRYLDNGSNQGTGWRATTFSDGSWKQGAAELGYGDGDERTVISYGSKSGAKYITTYFRHSFSVVDPAAFDSLRLRLMRDDGAVVYLNGAEVYRTNMPGGTIGYTTLASTAVGGADESTYYQTTVSSGGLVAGTNVLAVEVHQHDGTSSDVSFNLELVGVATQSGTVLSPAGSDWRFLDDGTDQGTAWRAPEFYDGGWNVGPAELGYGDGDEATVVGYGPSATAKFITTYFRRSFQVADPTAFKSLKLRLLRDDGAVVYLNGVEVHRGNMPTGTVTAATLASVAMGGADETTFFQSTLVNNLVVGTNVLAVELHQADGTSSDLGFDLELLGLEEAPAYTVTRGPYLQKANPTSLTVRWRTDVASNSTVRFGTSPAALDGRAESAPLTTEHSVTLTGLTPNTQYFYSVGTSIGPIASGLDYTFYTPPPVGTVQPTRIWAIGDSGTANANAAAVRDAYLNFNGSQYTDLWLMLGDNAYNSGTEAEYQAAVFDMYPSVLRQSALWSTLGNHDYYTSNGAPYFGIFDLPTQGEAGGAASGTEKYYSFDYANIHFICLDSMSSDRSATGAMATWLKSDLESTNQHWIIAFWHHPPYTKGSHNSDTEIELVQMRENFLPLLEAGGVDLVLGGHSHSYERSYLINGHYGTSTTFATEMKLDGGNGNETGDGVYEKPSGLAGNQGAVYIVAGSSGKATNWWGGSTADTNPNPHPVMHASLLRLGSMVIDVDGDRMDVKFLRSTGTVDYQFTMLKSIPNSLPVVSVTSPSNGATFTAPASIEITATAGDADGTVQQVDFYAGATVIGTDTSAPFTITWSGVAAGNYAITATSTDNLGATATSEAVNITVEAPPSPPAPPATLSAVAGDRQIGLTWSASADATSYTVKRATVSGGPYTTIAAALTGTSHTDASLTNGTTYFYVVTASSSVGESAPSTEASATPNAAPTVSLTSPADGATFQAPANVLIQASASDDVGIARVDFYSGSERIGTDDTAPYEALWSNAPAGTYTLTAKAVDTLNASTTSGAVQITVLPPPPEAPVGLEAVAGDARVTLSWEASAGAASYNVKRSQTAGGPYVLLTSGVTTTSHPDAGLTNGLTYFYVVSAVNAGGESGHSNEASASPVAPPEAPTGLSAAAGDGNVSLAWTGSAGATTYHVKRATVTGGPFTTIASGLSASSFNDATVTNGTHYFYVVSASNPGGESANSNEASARPMAPPATPADLTATAGDAQVTLAWSASEGATTYTLRRALDAAGPYTVLAKELVSTGFTDSTAANGTTYFYVVSAVNSVGESANSAPASATPMEPPSAPTGLVATAGNNSVALVWSGSAEAATYRVQRATVSGGPYATIAGAVTATSFTDTTVTNGTTCFYVVSATNAGGESALSNEASATPIAPPLPPSSVTAAPGNGKVDLAWTASAGATSYRVKRSTTSGEPYEVATGVNGTSFTDLTVINGTTYFYVITASNAGGESANSYEVSAMPVDPPSTPTGLSATAGDASVSLSWTAANGASSYRVKRADVSGGPYAEVATNIVGTSFTDASLTNGEDYFYVISAVNDGGESANSTEASATPMAPPAAPTNLIAKAGNGSVALTWIASSGAESYSVKRGTVQGGPYTEIASALPGSSFDDTTVTNGSSYYYVVTALGVGGESALSNEATATPMAPPVAPTGLTATGGNARVTLRWQASEGAASYNVKRSETAGGSYVLLASDVTTTSHPDAGLTNGVTYFYVVSAVNAVGESADSAEASATPAAGVQSPWLTQDIGAVAAAGTASEDDGTFTVEGSGADISGKTDEFRYVYQVASGDCSITARVVSLENTDASAKAGVMIRETLAADSRHASVSVTPSNGISFQRRTSTAGPTASTTNAGMTAPYWVRVTRSGRTIRAYRSADGVSWTLIGSVKMTMATDVYIGLPVTSRDDGILTTAVFDNVAPAP